MPVEIDRAAPMWENYKHDVQTQAVSAFRRVSATGSEVGSNLCPDEKGTERRNHLLLPRNRLRSNLCPDEKGTER